jgi:protein-S-isoprenylcysteine O-methyltransferase Ste14
LLQVDRYSLGAFVYAVVYSRDGISELDIDDIVPDLIFSVVGVVPMVIAALLTYWTMRENPAKA